MLIFSTQPAEAFVPFGSGCITRALLKASKNIQSLVLSSFPPPYRLSEYPTIFPNLVYLRLEIDKDVESSNAFSQWISPTRFPSLKVLRIKIDGKKAHRFTNYQMIADILKSSKQLLAVKLEGTCKKSPSQIVSEIPSLIIEFPENIQFIETGKDCIPTMVKLDLSKCQNIAFLKTWR